ncbi:MAG: M48 family metallopeptidase [Thiolinea sp.]
MKTATLQLPDGRQLDYQIRLSKRAKYMRLTFSGDKGLVVTQPVGVPNGEINHWIQSKLEWISTNLDKLNERNQHNSKSQPLQRPKQIEIPLLKQTLRIQYQPDSRREIITDYDRRDTLTLSGMTDDTEFCIHVLQKWLKQYARIPLGKLLEEMSEHTGLQYSDYRVKAQRTRWGSCSGKKNINLNYKLALMPEHWARYTVIHELCHTVEMNHSRRFWALVRQFVPDYKIIHAEMKNASLILPDWVNFQPQR